MESSLDTIFIGIANRVITDGQFIEIERLMGKYQVGILTRESAIIVMRKNVSWLEKNTRKIQQFLDRNSANKIVTTWLIAVMIFAVKLF